MKYFVRMNIQVEWNNQEYTGTLGFETNASESLNHMKDNALAYFLPDVHLVENEIGFEFLPNNRFKLWLLNDETKDTLYLDGYLMDLKQIVKSDYFVWIV